MEAKRVGEKRSGVLGGGGTLEDGGVSGVEGRGPGGGGREGEAEGRPP